MKYHDFEIEQFNHNHAKVMIDGKEMQGVTYANYEIGVGDIPEITIRFIPGTLNLKDRKEDNTKLPHTHEAHLEVRITEMETFKKVLNLLMDFVCDERLDKDLRYSYFGKLQKIKEEI